MTLEQLVDFSSGKSKDKVRHALYGAAFGSGMQSPAQILKSLDTRMAALLKRDTVVASAAINNGLREAAAVESELRSREPDLVAYEYLRQEQDSLRKEYASLAKERSACADSLRKAERRLAAWQQWEALQKITKERTVFNELSLPEFTPDALHRLDALLSQEEERLLALRGSSGR